MAWLEGAGTFDGLPILSGTGVWLEIEAAFSLGGGFFRCTGGGDGDSIRNLEEGTRCRFILRSSVAGVGGASLGRFVAEDAGVSGWGRAESFSSVLLGVDALKKEGCAGAVESSWKWSGETVERGLSSCDDGWGFAEGVCARGEGMGAAFVAARRGDSADEKTASKSEPHGHDPIPQKNATPARLRGRSWAVARKRV